MFVSFIFPNICVLVKSGNGGGGKSSRVSHPSAGESDYEDGLEESKKKKGHRGGGMDDR